MHSWTRAEYLVSTDPERLDLALIREILADSYWAEGVPQELGVCAAEGARVQPRIRSRWLRCETLL